MIVLKQPTRREMLAVGATGLAALATASKCLAAGETKNGPHLPLAKPEDIGLDSRRLQVAYDFLESWTTGPKPPVPGGAILVGRHGKRVATRSFGRQGPEADAPSIRPDGMFLLASISKPITYLGAMLLVERGRLNLNDPVARYLPEFADAGKFATHSKKDVLVSHLFTHTSGLPDMLPNNLKLRADHAPLSQFVEGAIRAELMFKPGTNHSYQSMGTLLTAEIIQRLSGQPIDVFLKKEIFDPLGLTSTGLGSGGFPRERLVRVEDPNYQNNTNFSWNSDYWQKLGAPWGGMFSTPEDFAVLCQLMLAGGSWNGVKLFAPATVRMMTTNRLNDYPDLPEPIRRTQPWGLGWRMNHLGTSGSWGDLLGRHIYGHTGATGTTVWMDPRTQGFCILFTTALRAKAPWRLVHLSNAIAAAFA